MRNYVLDVLREFPETRNDDAQLFLKVIVEKYGIPPERPLGMINFDELPSYSTVRRRRAEIQNGEGRYIPTSVQVLATRQMWFVGSREACPLEILAEEGIEAYSSVRVCRKCPRIIDESCPRKRGEFAAKIQGGI